MGRKAIPAERRSALVRDQRQVTLLSRDEKQALDEAVERHGYIASADLVREAIAKKLERLARAGGKK